MIDLHYHCIKCEGWKEALGSDTSPLSHLTYGESEATERLPICPGSHSKLGVASVQDRSGTQSERGGLPGQLLSGPGHGGWGWPFLTGGHTQSRTRALWPVRKGPRDTVLSLVPWRSRFSNSLGRERPSERISGFKIPGIIPGIITPFFLIPF